MNTVVQVVQQRKALVALVGGALLGLVLGLAIGWWWWPVEWTNSTPGNLRLDFQSDYLIWVAEQYDVNTNQEWARSRLGVEYWKEGQLAETLEALAATLDGEQASRVRKLAQDLGAGPSATPATPEAGDDVVVRLGSLAMVCGVAILVVALVAGLVFILNRWRASQAVSEAPRRGVGLRPSEEVRWGVEGPPVAQFVTTYVLGDDHYDPSFSIELENGEFMGECGVGVSETIGVGAPNQVTAFEVWLFDKNDIRTVTKVLMSDYAFHDEALVAKLAPKGEPVLAEVGKDVVLETKTLRVRARIVEAEYGMGNVPRDSFFSRMTLDLATWVMPGQWGTQPTAGADVPTMPRTV
ncbi:MAG: hypothetical protein GWN58_40735 [Anaerolineae bacterium]|nr:hypothetical protein [Anaerolineae bacterium]